MMPTKIIDLSGDKELMAVLQKAQSQAPVATRKVLHNVGMRARANARAMAPWDTGFLHDHINMRSTGDNITIRSQAGYSGFVNYGTRYQSAQPYFSWMVTDMQTWLKSALVDVARGLLK